MASEKINKVFVYGTLMSGQALNPVFELSKCFGFCDVEGFDLYFSGAYPFCVKGKGTITGEIYSLSHVDLALLDRVESVDSGLYSREIINTKYGKAYIYVGGKEAFGFNEYDYPKIENGDWKEYVFSNMS